jgi:serine/threonine protein phosphatase PrpC
VTTLHCAGLSDRGRVRERNQDRWSADVNLGLFIVSDGMGGRSAGEVAAEIVVTTLPTLISTHFGATPDLAMPDAPQRLSRALAELNADLVEGSQHTPQLAGMGATTVVALVRHNTALIAHLGDSRAYLWREHRLRRLTRDHSLAQALLDAGEIGEHDVADHPARHQLIRHMGMHGEVLPEARRITLCPADRLLLCSDGLTSMLDDARLQTILNHYPDPDYACRALIKAANGAGGTDNITALVIIRTG